MAATYALTALSCQGQPELVTVSSMRLKPDNRPPLGETTVSQAQRPLSSAPPSSGGRGERPEPKWLGPRPSHPLSLLQHRLERVTDAPLPARARPGGLWSYAKTTR